jgi:hypothetical protein
MRSNSLQRSKMPGEASYHKKVWECVPESHCASCLLLTIAHLLTLLPQGAAGATAILSPSTGFRPFVKSASASSRSRRATSSTNTLRSGTSSTRIRGRTRTSSRIGSRSRRCRSRMLSGTRRWRGGGSAFPGFARPLRFPLLMSDSVRKDHRKPHRTRLHGAGAARS